MRSYYVCTLRPNTLLLLLGEERKEKEDLNSSPALNKISYLSKRRGRRVADKPFNRRVLPGHSLYFGLFCLEGGRSVDVCPLRRKTEMGLSAAAAAAAAGMSGAIYYTDKASKRTPFNSCCIPQLLVGNSWKSLDPPRCFLSPPLFLPSSSSSYSLHIYSIIESTWIYICRDPGASFSDGTV